MTWILFFFFNDTATTEIYTLSLHDALPISSCASRRKCAKTAPTWKKSAPGSRPRAWTSMPSSPPVTSRSEEHTSELQSQSNLVCRLLLEKKKEYNARHQALHQDYLSNSNND